MPKLKSDYRNRNNYKLDKWACVQSLDHTEDSPAYFDSKFHTKLSIYIYNKVLIVLVKNLQKKK